MKHKHQLAADSLSLWLGKPAPRYTSYPPAPFFQAGAAHAAYAESLADLAPEEPVSLYIHIPFCRSLCLYCGCNTTITHRNDRMASYLAAVKREMSVVAEMVGKRRVHTLHFGGGTPNAISDASMRDLFDHLRQVFDFDKVHEIAMELDPRVVTQEQVKTLVACGVTRVSLGVQDFDAEVQDIIHRRQPFEMVARVCGWLRAAGIRFINFDLMYGLPKQTTQTVADTATLACSLQPDRIALFSYAHVPQLKKHQKALEEHGLPDLHERLHLEQVSRGILIQHGYHAIGIDHFAKYNDPLMRAWRAGKLHRNFQGYTEDNIATLLSFGASAISQTPDGYFQNARDDRDYQEMLSNGQLPVCRSFFLLPEDKMRRDIIEQLMCTMSCDLEAICKRYDYPVEWLADDLARLKPYEDAGLVARRGYALCVTTPYRMAVRVICEAFDHYTRYAAAPASRTA